MGLRCRRGRQRSSVCHQLLLDVGEKSLETIDYEAFHLDPRQECVQTAQSAVTAIGREPQLAVSNGGLDANWLNAHGIPTVTLGCGQMNVHTTSEMLDLAAYRDACRIALWLATSA